MEWFSYVKFVDDINSLGGVDSVSKATEGYPFELRADVLKSYYDAERVPNYATRQSLATSMKFDCNRYLF